MRILNKSMLHHSHVSGTIAVREFPLAILVGNSVLGPNFIMTCLVFHSFCPLSWLKRSPVAIVTGIGHSVQLMAIRNKMNPYKMWSLSQYFLTFCLIFHSFFSYAVRRAADFSDNGSAVACESCSRSWRRAERIENLIEHWKIQPPAHVLSDCTLIW